MKVGIIGAMEPEIAILRERMSDVETHQHAEAIPPKERKVCAE